MKSIVCPIDFSGCSLNGLEHAAHIAKTLNANLLLLYIRISLWPEATQLEHAIIESNEDIHTKLKNLCNEVNKELGVPCHHHLESTTMSFEDCFAKYTFNKDLVVMGTNGADGYYQYFFGSNSFRVMEKSKCPVLVIPEDCAYRPIKSIVYAYDPETNPIFLIDQLKQFAMALGASIKVLHIAEETPTEKSKHELEVMGDAVNLRRPKEINWSFSYQFKKDIPLALNNFMNNYQADVMAFSFHPHSLMENWLGENVIKRASAIANYPIFVFWH